MSITLLPSCLVAVCLSYLDGKTRFTQIPYVAKQFYASSKINISWLPVEKLLWVTHVEEQLGKKLDILHEHHKIVRELKSDLRRKIGVKTSFIQLIHTENSHDEIPNSFAVFLELYEPRNDDDFYSIFKSELDKYYETYFVHPPITIDEMDVLCCYIGIQKISNFWPFTRVNLVQKINQQPFSFTLANEDYSVFINCCSRRASQVMTSVCVLKDRSIFQPQL